MTRVGRFDLIEDRGVWFLQGHDEQIAGTLIPQPDGTWRCKIPDGGVRTVSVPDTVPDDARPLYVARQIVTSPRAQT